MVRTYWLDNEQNQLANRYRFLSKKLQSTTCESDPVIGHKSGSVEQDRGFYEKFSTSIDIIDNERKLNSMANKQTKSLQSNKMANLAKSAST